jgi:hypothetical protein
MCDQGEKKNCWECMENVEDWLKCAAKRILAVNDKVVSIALVVSYENKGVKPLYDTKNQAIGIGCVEVLKFQMIDDWAKFTKEVEEKKEPQND